MPPRNQATCVRNLKSDHFVNKSNINEKRAKHPVLSSVFKKQALLIGEVFLSLPIFI